MSIIRIDDPNKFVGMEVKQAQSEIKSHGYDCRIVWLEGRTIVPPASLNPKNDYDPLRVNLHVKSAKVTKANIG